jgi:hypothetical protein
LLLGRPAAEGCRRGGEGGSVLVEPRVPVSRLLMSLGLWLYGESWQIVVA